MRRVLIVSCAWMAVSDSYLVVPHTLVEALSTAGPSAELLVETGATMLVLSALWLIFDTLDAFTAILRDLERHGLLHVGRLVVSWVIFIPAGMRSS